MVTLGQIQPPPFWPQIRPWQQSIVLPLHVDESGKRIVALAGYVHCAEAVWSPELGGRCSEGGVSVATHILSSSHFLTEGPVRRKQGYLHHWAGVGVAVELPHKLMGRKMPPL